MDDSLVRKKIFSGPGRFRLWLNRLVGRPTAFVLENYGPTAVLISAVQQLRQRPDVVSFLGGRLFANGQVTTAWGEYNTAQRTGQLWIMSIPDPYTPYYGDPEVRGRWER